MAVNPGMKAGYAKYQKEKGKEAIVVDTSNTISHGLSAEEYAKVSKYVDANGELTKAYFSDSSKDSKYPKGDPRAKVSKEIQTIIDKIPGMSKNTPIDIDGSPTVVSQKELVAMSKQSQKGKINIGIGTTTLDTQIPMAKVLRKSIEQNKTLFLVPTYSGMFIENSPPPFANGFYKATKGKLYSVNPNSSTQKNGLIVQKWSQKPILEVK